MLELIDDVWLADPSLCEMMLVGAKVICVDNSRQIVCGIIILSFLFLDLVSTSLNRSNPWEIYVNFQGIFSWWRLSSSYEALVRARTFVICHRYDKDERNCNVCGVFVTGLPVCIYGLSFNHITLHEIIPASSSQPRLKASPRYQVIGQMAFSVWIWFNLDI